MKFVSLCLLLSLHMPAVASDYSALLKEAAAALDNDYELHWAYTETSVDSDSTTVARFNPANPVLLRWNLLTVDGRIPTETEITEFREEKAGDDSADGEDEDDDDTGKGGKDAADIVQPDSLSLIEETDDYWLFSFKPVADEDTEAMFEHVDATLKIARNGPFVETIKLQNDKPFKPKLGVKISNFFTRMNFGPAAEDGPIVPLSTHFHIKARAFLVTSFEEESSITYGDYEYVGD